MEAAFKYGHNEISISLDDKNILGVLISKAKVQVKNPSRDIANLLRHPAGCAPLYDSLLEKKPVRPVILVNDATRPTPYYLLLPPLLDVLVSAGIDLSTLRLVVAAGAHRPNSPRENLELYTEAVTRRCNVINHNAEGELAGLGLLSNGEKLLVNPEVAGADFVIATGNINPHEIAGFSGGRKSVLPGVAGRGLIEKNHSLINDYRVDAGRWKDNPVHLLMVEAAKKVGVDFILNVVTDGEGNIAGTVAGDLEIAWEAGVEISKAVHVVPAGEKADVVIAGAGGYPRDMNVYQAVKAMRNAARTVRGGGTVVLLAQCHQGYGDETMTRWFKAAGRPQDILDRLKEGFVLGGHKAYAIAQVCAEKEVVLVSSLSPEDTRGLFMTYMPDPAAALEYVRAKHGPDYKAYVMPHAGITLPEVAENIS